LLPRQHKAAEAAEATRHEGAHRDEAFRSKKGEHAP
jgi:hypothetical protein